MSVFTIEGTENRMRWDRASEGFMEVWYATVNHTPSGAGVWIRYAITSPRAPVGPPYCALWAFCFGADGSKKFAGKQRFSIDQLGSSDGRDDGALVRIGDAWLSESHLEGEVSAEGRSMSWSLDFDPADRCFQHIPAQIRRRAEHKFSTVCSPNLSVPFSGTIKIDGESLELDAEPGCQSHRWGRRHPSSWAWGHCSAFEGADDAVFEGLAARANLGPVPLPTQTLLYLSYQGKDLAFNDLRTSLRAKGRYEMPTWAFTASNDQWKIAGAGRVRLDRMVQVTYEDPDGSSRYCANSEVADLAVSVSRRTPKGWVHDGELTALRKAHLEFGRRLPFDELPISF
jgi:hypothetical protein